MALSSAEAELHAMVAASAEVMGITGLLGDVGIDAKGEIYADSSAALGITNRIGTGKVTPECAGTLGSRGAKYRKTRVSKGPR